MKAIFPDLENKIVLVTGATRGIGRTIALSLAAQKAHVVFNHRNNQEAAMSLAADIEKAGGKATALNFDITDYTQVQTELDVFMKNHGPITGLVNNAGKSKDQLLLRVKETDIEDIINTNLKATMVLTNHLVKTFMRAENVSIVNMSSIVGLMGNVAQSNYAASKAGLIGYTKAFAKELAGRNVRANAICPGFIATDMTDALTDKAKEEYFNNIPLKRFGTTEEVANLTCFLLSQASGYITGEVIKIDGGLYI